MANVIFTSTGTAGDVLPLIRIGSRLKGRGHDVHLLTHAHYAGLAREAGLEFAALDNAAEYEQFVEDGPLLNTPHRIPEFMRRHYFPKVLAECKLIEQRYRPGDTVVIARDLFDLGARLVAERLRIPLLWIFMAPSQLLNGQLRRELFARVLAKDVNRLREQLALGAISDWHSWLSNGGRHPALWPEWFAAPDPAWPAKVVPVGFVVDNEDESGELPDSVRASLDAAPSPILISGGTGTYSGIGFYGAATNACLQLNRPGILVTDHDRLVPADLPVSIRHCHYLPMGKVMPRVAAVVHHGGRGTLSCALAAATPQVVLASGADRQDNASRLERLGVAKYLALPSWKPEKVAEALLRLTESVAVRNCCQDLADRIRGSDSLAQACDVIESAV